MLRLGPALACSLLVLTAGCGEEDGRATDPGTTTSPTSSPATSPTDTPTSAPTPSPSASPSSPATTPPSGALDKVRVVGRVVRADDCVVVEDDNATTWTIGGPLGDGLEVGERVQVTGTPDLTATGCGGPLVEAVRAEVLPDA